MITVKAMLRPEALHRFSEQEFRFCATPSCPVVYFGGSARFEGEDLVTHVFQKEPAGARTVCYCFAVTEADIRSELIATGRSTAVERISELVRAGRCACELENPQGSCCLGNLAAVTRALATGP